MDLAAQVVDYVANGESKGKFWAQNRNSDHQGLSYGIIQWSQRSGALGKLLAQMRGANPATFAQIFGPGADDLVRTTTSPDEATRMSLPLWQEPWTSRFTAAGHIRTFQIVQDEAAVTGASMQAALDLADLFELHTERALVLFFDRANHHGGYGAKKLATSFLAKFPGSLHEDPHELLADFAAWCAAPYRRTSAPTQVVVSGGKSWKQVGNEWHLFAGNADLYAIIARRTGEILEDPALSDEPVENA